MLFHALLSLTNRIIRVVLKTFLFATPSPLVSVFEELSSRFLSRCFVRLNIQVHVRSSLLLLYSRPCSFLPLDEISPRSCANKRLFSRKFESYFLSAQKLLHFRSPLFSKLRFVPQLYVSTLPRQPYCIVKLVLLYVPGADLRCTFLRDTIA